MEGRDSFRPDLKPETLFLTRPPSKLRRASLAVCRRCSLLAARPARLLSDGPPEGVQSERERKRARLVRLARLQFRASRATVCSASALHGCPKGSSKLSRYEGRAAAGGRPEIGHTRRTGRPLALVGRSLGGAGLLGPGKPGPPR